MTGRPWPFRLKLNLAGGLILLTVVTGWLIAHEMTRRMNESAGRVAETQGVVSSLRRIQTDRTLTPADREELEQLRSLSAGNPRRRAHLDAAARFLSERTGQDQPIGAEMGAILFELENEELRIFAGQIQESRTRAQSATNMLVANQALTFLVLLAAAVQFNRDLTRRQRADRELREAKQAADAANQAKTQFLATVSHEIRTPLNAISGMSELLLETRLDPEQGEFARSVHGNAEALGILIGDLLDSSKIEAGQLDLQPAPFDLRDLVESVAEILAVRAEGKGVDLVVDLPPEGPWQLVGDRNRLRQVLMNLVGNAVKFTDAGEVSIEAQITPSADRRAAAVSIHVRDTGIGIAPEAQGRIFERFVQADRTTVTRFGGTGLGLNISRSLIELMGGRLSVASTLGHGSTFTVAVTLPLAAVQPPAGFDRSSLAGIEIVLVEANQSQRTAAVRVLEFAGASVRAFARPDEALPALPGGTSVVVVVGEPRPGSMTLEFAKTVVASQPSAGDGHVPLVLLCSLRSKMAGEVGSHGIAACVYSPVRQVRLVDGVRVAAGRPARPVAAADARPVPIAAGVAFGRILLVEDNRDNWILATRLLAAAGYDVEVAEDGQQAIDKSASGQYDLILMDIDLPKIDGLEAARQIRAREQAAGLSPVPMIAATAHAMENFRQEALSAGMDGYITKPIQKQAMIDMCEQWIGRRRAAVVVDDDVADLLPGYVSARQADLGTLRTLLTAGDFDGIRRIGHKIKGSGESYGLPLVGEAGRLLDQAGAAADADAARTAIAGLEQSLSNLRIHAADGRVIIQP